MSAWGFQLNSCEVGQDGRGMGILGIPTRFRFKLAALDFVSLAFVSVVLFGLAWHHRALIANPGILLSDPAYHMAVARNILEQGGVPKWDHWEFAPFGRPHLYPPLVHLLIAVLSGSAEHVLSGFNILQVVVYPLALLVSWLFARWLFGEVAGFLALLFTSMGTGFLLSCLAVLPSTVATILAPLILMAFLCRRIGLTVFLLTLSMYTHGPVGVAVFTILGLACIAVRHRAYRAPLVKILLVTLLLYSPWLLRVARYHAWLALFGGPMPIANLPLRLLDNMRHLLEINPFVMVPALGVLCLRREPRVRLLGLFMLGWLPMFLTYGGRFLVHTWPLWSLLAGLCFAGLFSRMAARWPVARWVGAGLCLTIAYLPLPIFHLGLGASGSVKRFPSVTAANLVLRARVPDRQPHDFIRLAECIRVTLAAEAKRDGPVPGPRAGTPTSEAYADYLESTAYQRLRQNILHVGTYHEGKVWGDGYFADLLTVYTGCRTDGGGWRSEVRAPVMLEEHARAREEDPSCLFVFRHPRRFRSADIEWLTERHQLEWTRRFGKRYLLGGRGIEMPAEADRTP